MTYSDDLNFPNQGTEIQDSGPVVFGITLTPTIIGGIVGFLGVAGAGYMLLNMVMPAWDTYQQLQTKSDQLQTEITQKKTQAQQIGKVEADLATSKEQQKQVLALFANEKSLDTLLLDTSRLIDSSNGKAFGNAIRAKLKKFVPVSEKPVLIEDGSFGAEVNNKLKRSIVNVEIEGDFAQTESIMRNIERLQPLLLVKNYNSKLTPPEMSEDKDNPVQIGIGKLTTTFALEALMPLTSEDTEALAAKAAAATKAAAPPPKK
ncbi:pilus assembly protein PilO [Dolichospermum sp. ST_con]|nr:pilus assembly protein PilO [Dolichospermum sp. ST_con]MDD1420132.1 pilus assembly protein PilO [Dolichospermum sp. ST_sed1]MDD1425717.1 pilus assembly protein PilO [Dolichospermum sp. ST_sed9]MDD1431764.1 pilus assembly protein PilO [Dolichospermum sp. ST_sed6]MDD1436356.1 pilus assembly protein PilO [Dolichospermum sp. ST_sed10]MDD1439527.1 pilus assembly protein PilO [Dolichospermum sp. ST_sed3]MDD1446854.1 pilus assembly protein PilO [Dolichospermum sp. ST_sed8]MDD1457904.1 pilus asse